MGVMKDGINHICKRLDDIRTLLQQIKYEAEVIRRRVEAMKAGEPPKDLTVQPVEKSNGEKLFLVTGEELCNLLEACRGAKIQMKEK